MKNKLFRYTSFLIVLVMVLSVTGCATVRDAGKAAVNEYDALIGFYQDAVKANSNFYLAVDSCYAKTQQANGFALDYYDSVKANTEAWTGHYEEAQAQAEEQLTNYEEATGGGTAENQDLAALAEQGLLPNTAGQGLIIFVNAVTQAPPPVVDSAVTLALMDMSSECFEIIRISGQDWNAAASKYNTEHDQVSGEVIQAAAAVLGHALPENLPFYQSENQGGSIRNPTATSTPVP